MSMFFRCTRGLRFVSLAAVTVALSLAADVLQAEDTKEAKVSELTLKVPTSWQQQPPENRLRLAQFEIPAVEGDKSAAELSIFNFGAGGTVEQQVARWTGQFEADGRQVKVGSGSIENLGDYVLADLSGTYLKPDGPPILRKVVPTPGSRMLVAMIQTDNGTYFLKLVGGEKTVGSAAEAFRKSFGADAETEKPLELPN